MGKLLAAEIMERVTGRRLRDFLPSTGPFPNDSRRACVLLTTQSADDRDGFLLNRVSNTVRAAGISMAPT